MSGPERRTDAAALCGAMFLVLHPLAPSGFVTCTRKKAHPGDHFAPPGFVWAESQDGPPGFVWAESQDGRAVRASSVPPATADGVVDIAGLRSDLEVLAARLKGVYARLDGAEQNASVMALMLLQMAGAGASPGVVAACWAFEHRLGVTVLSQWDDATQSMQLSFTLEREPTPTEAREYLEELARRQRAAALVHGTRQGFPRGVGR